VIFAIIMESLMKSLTSRPLKVKPFSRQSGGQRNSTVAAAKKLLLAISGNDLVSLMKELCDMKHNEYIRSSLFGDTIKPIVRAITSARNAASDREKPVIASLVAPHLSRKTLRELGLPLTPAAYANARKHAKLVGPGQPLPPPTMPESRHPLAQSVKDSIHKFCLEHSHPAANRIRMDHNKVLQAQRILDKSKAELHRQWQEEHSNQSVSRAAFYNLIDTYKVFKAARKSGTDMCEICARGKHMQAQLASHLHQQHNSNCPHAASCLPYTKLDQPFKVVPKLHTCTCLKKVNHYDFIINHITGFLHHHKLVAEQRDMYVTQRQSLKPGECQLVIDYKQNIYVNRGPVEIGKMFYERSQRSVLGMRLDWCDKNNVQHKQYIDYISCNLNHDGLYATDCVKNLVETMLVPNEITKLNIWVDMAGHFIGKEMTATLLYTLSMQYNLACDVNRFIDHHGKSPVDAHFSHLTYWIKELESNNVIVSTTQLIKGLMERAASHAKGRQGVDDGDKVSNVRFVEYRPACTHAPISRFIDAATNAEANAHNEDEDLHYIHQPLSSTQTIQTEVMRLFNTASAPIVYDHDNQTSQHVDSTTNLSTSLLEQIERSHTCQTPMRKRRFMTIPDNRVYYSFSSQPPAPNTPLIVTAKIIGNDDTKPTTLKYSLIEKDVDQVMKFAPRLPEHTVIKANTRHNARMMKRAQIYERSKLEEARQHNAAATDHLMALYEADLNDPTLRWERGIQAAADAVASLQEDMDSDYENDVETGGVGDNDMDNQMDNDCDNQSEEEDDLDYDNDENNMDTSEDGAFAMITSDSVSVEVAMSDI
jgi:hypothetical protein